MPFASLLHGMEATVQGTVAAITARRVPWRRMPNAEAQITDTQGSAMSVLWFNSPFLVRSMPPGTRLLLSGKVERMKGVLTLMHPQWEKVTASSARDAPTRIAPVYHLSGSLTQKVVRHLTAAALSRITSIPEHLPAWMLKDARLARLDRALRGIHRPADWTVLRSAEQRLKFDELFFLQLRGALARGQISQLKSIPLAFDQAAVKSFVDSLPFSLTQVQREAAWEIIKDLEKTRPMNRLLEGDVGSGKTAVAAIAAFHVTHGGMQAVYFAPTSILAAQHFETFGKLFAGTNLRIALLTQGDTRLQQIQNPNTKIQKKELINMIHKGRVDIAIGTHALLSESVQFKKLALVIVDEQHRFGVRQRHGLMRNQEGITPHFLSMTATPIPRSLALVAYGDLDLSVLDEMPKGRAAIATRIIGPHQRNEAYALIHEELRKCRQAFIICPLIDPSDKLGVKSVKEEAERLKREHFPEATLAMLHGKMSAEKKDAVMKDFSRGAVQVLVATPVVEVGIDVPNATVILIEGAERFGLAQLHQLRGRVGRSTYPSSCLLATDTESEAAIERLHAVVSSHDGFALAEKDLQMRGPGEVYGTTQAGFLDSLKIAKLTDAILLKQSKEAVTRLIAHDPVLQHCPAIRERLAAFEQSVHLE
jgi:ATP-dependent DNA helicase RecG